jgi:ubiquitin carboxyl-terminal hydrolase 4/11
MLPRSFILVSQLCFAAGVYQEELNPDNPLGMHGAIAEAFGALLHRIWAPNSTSTSYTPREFKQQLQRFAPQFSGYQQHDSQELVAFLLDGLHEDLNRVLKKPYVEKPDWEGGGDKELVELAQKSWEGYMMRNDSVIVDLFQGQYQSTLVCPECQKVCGQFEYGHRANNSTIRFRSLLTRSCISLSPSRCKKCGSMRFTTFLGTWQNHM